MENPDYDKTNNIYLLYLAKDYLCETYSKALGNNEYFEERDIRNLVLINPDNPSGNYVDSRQFYKLLTGQEIEKLV